jgi:UDPglucose 6-dehydrogenase
MHPADQKLIDKNVIIASDCYAAANQAHAIAVMTEWDEFKQLDVAKIYSKMHRPAFVFDGRNILDRKLYSDTGFEIHAIGRS